MSKYTSLLRDRTTLLTLVICIAGAFLGAAAEGIPYWLNWLIAVFILGIGLSFLEWRSRRIQSSLDTNVSVARVETTNENPDEQGKSTETSSNIEPGPRWEIVDASLRKNPMASGEGPTIFIGLASVEAEADERYTSLYYCYLMDRDNRKGYAEFRIPPLSTGIVQRSCSVRLSPGDIVAATYTWSQDSGLPFNNTLCRSEDIEYEMWRLLKSSERIVFYWTDKYQNQATRIEYEEKYRIIVTTEGLIESDERLGNLFSNVIMSSMNSPV